MKKTSFIALALALCSPQLAQAQVTDTPSGYSLVWSDEFEGTALDENAWTIEVNGNGGGNQELQYYIKDNVAVEDGCLVLTARREDYQGKKFTSGRINSRGKAAFKHGIMQARIKFPLTANGLWPAYWMMGNDYDKYGWPRCGEMDIVEMGMSQGITDGTQDYYFGGTLHYGPDATNENHQQISQDVYSLEEVANNTISDNHVADGWHIFTVEWDESNLYMYYDLQSYTNAQKRRARYFSNDVTYSDETLSPGHYFQKPFFFLFNLAVGGSYTGIYDESLITALPNDGDEAKMYVDWVRVYQEDTDEDAQYLYTDADGNEQTNIPVEEEPEHTADNTTVLSSFATQALDDSGTSTFDFDDCEDVVLISTSEGVTGNFQSRNAVLADYNVDETTNFLYIWDATYVTAGTSDQTNSFGWEEGYNRFEVASVGWSGLGFASTNGSKDLSMIDDTYWLHFAMKADDPDLHTSHTVYVGDAQFRIGETDGTLVSLGDFKRDGQWYYFDIPVSALLQLGNPIFGSSPAEYDGNVIAFLSGGTTGAELDFDNIFFYKSKTKEIPTYTDDSADLGKYGYKSLDDDGNYVFDFDNAQNITPLVLSQDVWEMLTAGGTYDSESTLVAQEHDLSEQGGKNNFFIWGDPQTFTAAAVTEVANSLGNVPYGGFSAYTSTSGSGWNGAGWASIDGQGNYPEAKDLSHIDDTYYVHLSLRSDAAVGHVPVSIKFGASDADAKITFGSYSTSPIYADFNRDGEWYSFDIPVTELKKYGALWSNADSNGGISAYTDYVLCFYTMPTYYTGSSFSIDNVFFYQPVEAEEVNTLGDYTTKSLDADGASYFDFSGKKYIPVTMGAAERLEAGEDNIIDDFSINDSNTHLYIWDSTFEGIDGVSPNSFGYDEGYTSLAVTNVGWSGLGIINDDGYNVSQITDDFYLHFAVRGTQSHDLHFILGKAHFTIGASGYVNASGEIYPQLGNFERDGEWYSYDIPMTEFWKINSNLWDGSAYSFTDNLICLDAGSTAGNEVHLDNVFFWVDADTYETATAISEITTATAQQGDQTMRIYDITGRERTSMSAPGLYIVRIGSTVKKVLVK